jgi:hypothetical protein
MKLFVAVLLGLSFALFATQSHAQGVELAHWANFQTAWDKAGSESSFSENAQKGVRMAIFTNEVTLEKGLGIIIEANMPDKTMVEFSVIKEVKDGVPVYIGEPAYLPFESEGGKMGLGIVGLLERLKSVHGFRLRVLSGDRKAKYEHQILLKDIKPFVAK